MYIGIVGNVKEKVSGVDINYMNWASNFGTPVQIPIVSIKEYKDLYSKLDAVILPGGADVDTKRYKKAPSYFTGNPDRNFEWFDTVILPEILGKIPVFGICRGLQTLNVIMGGTLTQHLLFHPYSQDEYDLVHDIFINNRQIMKTNSFHHQAIDTLGKGIVVEAYSGNGLFKTTEAISNYEKKFSAVQYHPERMDDIWTMEFFNKLI